MAPDLELLTVGRISVDLYCEELGADLHAACSFQKAVGGSPTNVAIAAARLGRRAAVYTKVGSDPFGEVVIGGSSSSALTCEMSARTQALTPLAFATLDLPEDPTLLFRREPPVPDLQLESGEVDDGTVAGVPLLWITGGSLRPSRAPRRCSECSALADAAGSAGGTRSLTSTIARRSGVRASRPPR